jgi:hypothetical protein
MPTFEFTSPEGKKFSVDGPAGSTKEQAFQVLQAQLSGGQVNPQVNGVPGMDPSALAGNRNVGQAHADPSLVERAKGIGEAGLSLLTGATGGAVGMLGGAVKGLAGSVMDGTFGTQAGVRQVEQNAAQGADALTYHPRTQTGQEYTAAASDALNAALPVMVAPELAALGRGASAGAKTIRETARNTAPALNAADAAAVATKSATGFSARCRATPILPRRPALHQVSAPPARIWRPNALRWPTRSEST